MRYLKLFENNEDITIDKDYIESCFVDFIDEDNFKLMFHGRVSSLTCEITIDMSDSSLPFSSSISEFTKRTEMRNYLFNRIEECLSKVKIEYPTISQRIYPISPSPIFSKYSYSHFPVIKYITVEKIKAATVI